MSDEQFLPKNYDGKLAHIAEECGEVLAAAGKTQRFGYLSVNPLLPLEEQETNLDWLMRELEDLKQAITRFQDGFSKETP